MVVVIRETQKLVSETDHVLTDEQFKIFKTLKGHDRIDFLTDADSVMVEEDIKVVGDSSVFKIRKNLSEDEKILAARMVDKT